MRLPTALIVALFCALIPAPRATADDRQPNLTLHDRAAASGCLVPVTPLGDGTITIDGNLSDWGDLRTDSFAMHQVLDHSSPDFRQSWKLAWTDQPLDAALVKVRRTDDALLIAIKVADRVVVSPADNRLAGDVIDLYLDLRPIAGPGPRAGHVKWTDGVYQLVFAPPVDGQPLHVLEPEGPLFTDWRTGRTVARLGTFEAAGKVVEGGYTLELRLPLASFPHKPDADRLTRPFGFEVMIADRDGTRPKGQPDRMYYSCTGYAGGSNYFKSLHVLACADPNLRTQLPMPRLKPNALRNAPGGGEPEGWIVTDIGVSDPADVAEAFRDAVRALEASNPLNTSRFGELQFDANAPTVTYPCKPLGIAFHHRRVLHRLPASAPAAVGNRYMAVHPIERPIRVDGKLDDWPHFSRRAMTLHQAGMMVWCIVPPGRNDVAQIAIETSDDVLHFAAQVRDDSFVHPGGKDAPTQGDCVQVFLDLRDPHAAANPMSSGQYSDGVYHFILVPRTHDDPSGFAVQGDQEGRQGHRVNAAFRRTDDGYTVEAAFRLSSLLEGDVSGRFERPFGFETLVTDVDAAKPGADKPGAFRPRLSYGWCSSTESQLHAQPSHFNLADHVRNRLPEIRALIDDTPATITLDAGTKGQPVLGFGGNYPRDAMLSHTGGRASRFALKSASTHYVAKHASGRLARVNLHLFPWEWVNDNGDPNRSDLSRFESTEGKPGHQHENNPGPGYKAAVDDYLRTLADRLADDVALIAHVDNWPGWLFPEDAGGTIPRRLWPEFAECLSSYMKYARDEHGIEFYAYALRNPQWGRPRYADATEYAALVTYLGKHFKEQGLKTKMLLCDTDSIHDWRWLAPIANDRAMLEHVAGIGLETAGPLDFNMPSYRLWADLARHIDRPLIITQFGRPYTSSPTYLFDEVRIWQQLTRDVGAAGGIIQQYVSEKSNKWLMVHAGQVKASPDKPAPSLEISYIAEDQADVLPTLRLGITQQFARLTPSGHAVHAESSHPQVMVTAFTGDAGFTAHISNAGPNRKAVIEGLPRDVRNLRFIHTGSGALFHTDKPIKVQQDGRLELALPAWSVVTLTTMEAE